MVRFSQCLADSLAIIQAFYRKLSDVTWMDKVSAEAAQNKAKVIIPKVGYPLVPDNTDAESLRQWYKGVNIDEDDYFGNVVKSRMGESSREWMNLGKQRDRRTWWVSILTFIKVVYGLIN